MFYHQGKWFTTTNRKLNAFNSKWSSSMSFGNLFVEALEHECTINRFFSDMIEQQEGKKSILEKFQNSLDLNLQYFFLLRSTNENRIVTQAPTEEEPYLYHIATFDNQSLVNSTLPEHEVNVNLRKPEKISEFTLANLLDYVDNRVNPYSHQGVVCIGPNNEQVKIYHPKYQELSRVRGNEPSVKYRYLQIRTNPEMKEKLQSLYPNMTHHFVEYEHILAKIAYYICQSYVSRFIKKNFVVVPQEEYKVIQECHTWHLENREMNKISLEKVVEVLNQQSPTTLNHMIRRYKEEMTN
jgi:hypothetical protein